MGSAAGAGSAGTGAVGAGSAAGGGDVVVVDPGDGAEDGGAGDGAGVGAGDGADPAAGGVCPCARATTGTASAPTKNHESRHLDIERIATALYFRFTETARQIGAWRDPPADEG
ncbi:MAG TPA: hypothetical protein VF103_14720 [Polyangiaceae bacterium]